MLKHIDEDKTRDVICGLMEIAEIAMPTTYFATDSRVNAAREWLIKHAKTH